MPLSVSVSVYLSLSVFLWFMLSFFNSLRQLKCDVFYICIAIYSSKPMIAKTTTDPWTLGTFQAPSKVHFVQNQQKLSFAHPLYLISLFLRIPRAHDELSQHATTSELPSYHVYTKYWIPGHISSYAVMINMNAAALNRKKYLIEPVWSLFNCLWI